ncbi:2,6-dihydroxypyridine 3-monooxygenase [Cyphellophora attinorum]|uniref:2,6-dihydroxypyridine 3-monooxygenase n=1 Tax=Cyphellophora attinorum TaxID=1664694 RepID=A0A0N1HH25_9EURO|nr:2,6-dihydroxypyridine 3-monooxygenase [Phialophora attinorum]KPI34927.1 2,6-dihydroxypyridine 3-monooxygenase [Phialophora attinorum]
MEPPKAPSHVLIVGGSLSGLFTAVALLQRLPATTRVTILERSPSPLLHDQGAGIVAGGPVLEWCERFAGKKQDEMSVESRERLYLDKGGKVIDREGTRQQMTSWDLLYGLGREVLDGNGTGSERFKYAFGREVTGLSEEQGLVKIMWKSTMPEEGGKEGVEEGDFLVAADGPSSRLRSMLLVDESASRTYAGYVAFRGTVIETELSQDARAVFVEKFTFFHGDGIQILAYTIPGQDGTLEVGKRRVNWVWYWNVEDESQEYGDIMTDSDGGKHRFTLPTGGKMQQHVWERQKDRAKKNLPPQFAELVTKTEKPFVQAITDVKPPSKGTEVGRLLGGRGMILGDALAGFRPHTAASTAQAAFDVLKLDEVFAGDLGWAEYERQVLDFAHSWQARGVMLGTRSQFGHHPLANGSDESVSRKQLHMREK